MYEAHSKNIYKDLPNFVKEELRIIKLKYLMGKLFQMLSN